MKIAPKISLLLIAGMLIIVGVMSYFIIRQTEDTLNKQIDRLLTTNLQNVEDEVRAITKSIKKTTQTIAHQAPIHKALSLEQSRGINRILNDLVGIYTFYNYILIVEPGGDIFAASTRDSGGKKISGEQLLGKNIKENLMYVSPPSNDTVIGPVDVDPFLETVGLKPGLSQWFIAPVIKKGRELIGWVVVSYDWRGEMSKMLEDSANKLKSTGNKTAEVFMVSTEGNIVAGSVGEGGKFILSARRHYMEKSLRLGSTEMKLVMSGEIDEINKPVKEIRDLLVVIIFSGSLILIVFFYALLQKILLRRLKMLSAGTEELNKGNYNYRIAEIGHDEIGDLANTFNRMSQSLEMTIEQLNTEKALLDRQVKERTKELNYQIFALDEHSIVSATDHKGTINYVNDKFCEIGGYTRDELIGKNHRILKSGEHAPEFYRDMWHTIVKGKTWHGEVKNKRKDGGFYWVKATMVPFMDESGKPYKYISIRTDITERKIAEEELHKAKAYAETANKAKSEFLASMSHEIRTPMNAIIGMADLLGETELTEEQEKYVTTFHNAGENLLAIINDILDVSKIEAGHLEMERVCFDIGKLLEHTGEIMAFRSQEKGIELAVSLSPEVPNGLIGDPTRLRQVITNLIGNAIKFTEQGEVVVSAETHHSGKDEIEMVFSVRDTGIGIPEEKLQSIFESFSQADSSTTRKYGGTGLGLAISKRIVDLMGGRIWAESKEGVGSVFYFTGKFGINEECQKSIKSQDVDLTGVKVLIVDDNATNRMILQKTLSSWGAATGEAKSGKSCLAELKREKEKDDPYRLVLLDNHMPGMDGFEVAESIVSDPGLKLPIIILTSSDVRTDKSDRVRELGLAGYIAKPVKKSDLRKTILAALGRLKIKETVRVSRKEAATAVRPINILLVEDNRDNRNLILAYLKKTPHTVDIAENGQIAVDKFTSGKYDLVLMDMEMPVMDGLTATRKIREWEKDQASEPTPIVALTAHALKEHEEKSKEAGCDGHVTKPIKKATLLRTISEYIV